MKFNAYAGMIASSWLLAAMVVASELAPSFKQALASAFSHHWIGKGVLTALAFVIIGFAFASNAGKIAGKRQEDAAWWSALGSLVVIIAFFVFEFVS